jgi:hypothetical protein
MTAHDPTQKSWASGIRGRWGKGSASVGNRAAFTYRARAPILGSWPEAFQREQTMAEGAVQRTRQLGSRQLAIRAIDRALSEFLPNHLRTSAERSLVHRIHSLTKNVHLNAAELRILEHVVDDIKAVITERSNSK